MEVTESIESINSQLIDLFGIDTVNGLAIWRIVWSDDQFEKRLGTYEDRTPNGLYIRTVTEVREVPKYSQWVQHKYVLEQLVIVPAINQDTLPTSQISYEPMFVFEDKWGNPLPPQVRACKMIIDSVYAAKGKTSMAKYVDDPVADQAADVAEIYETLFGDETAITDALKYGAAVTVPSNYDKKVN